MSYTQAMAETTPHEYREHIGTCEDCGNSPVNHRMMFIVQTINVWVGRTLGRRSRAARAYASFMRWGRKYSDHLVPAAFSFGNLIGSVAYGHDPAQSSSYRSQVIWEEAQKRGIPMEQLIIFKEPTDMYRAKIGGRWVYFESLPIPTELPQDSYEWMSDKFALKEALQEAGVPVPRAYSVTSRAQALSALRSEDGPVTVKPQAGSRGRHTTTVVSTEADMLAAFESARVLCAYVAVEQHLFGAVSRATVVNGNLVGFFSAQPPRIVGDGSSTIRQLVEQKNQTRHERVSAVVLNAEHEKFVRRLGYTLDSVPNMGRVIDLTHRTGRLFGGQTRELLDTVHPKLRAYAEKAARVLGVPVVGFDLIVPDPEQDPDGQQWGIIEANGLPFIDLHYLPLYGKPSHTAAAVWDLWEKEKETA